GSPASLVRSRRTRLRGFLRCLPFGTGMCSPVLKAVEALGRSTVSVRASTGLIGDSAGGAPLPSGLRARPDIGHFREIGFFGRSGRRDRRGERPTKYEVSVKLAYH